MTRVVFDKSRRVQVMAKRTYSRGGQRMKKLQELASRYGTSIRSLYRWERMGVPIDNTEFVCDFIVNNPYSTLASVEAVQRITNQQLHESTEQS